MKKDLWVVLLILTAGVSGASAAENVAWDPGAGAVTSKASVHLNLKTQQDLSSRPDALVMRESKPWEGNSLPYLISAPKPIQYPKWARRQGLEGELVLALEVLENGDVGRWQIVKSTGNDLLDKHAVGAVRAWKFHPSLRDGKPVRTCIQVPINFELTPE